MRIEQILICIKHPVSVFKIKIIIFMILEPKHEKFKDQYKIKSKSKKIFDIRRHMYVYISGF
jgi:hypothetical protein